MPQQGNLPQVPEACHRQKVTPGCLVISPTLAPQPPQETSCAFIPLPLKHATFVPESPKKWTSWGETRSSRAQLAAVSLLQQPLQ